MTVPTPTRSQGVDQTLTGSHVVVEALRRTGGRRIFGYPGGAVLPLYDVLFQQDTIRHVLVRHEQGAVHAADGYARRPARSASSLVTSGPGATNTVTGLANALHGLDPDRLPTGQVPTPHDRQRRLPGGRHGRHHPPVHQAQLPG